jgi:CheY-like chemotaxis protein
VVDDDPAVREVLTLFLQRWGHAVDPADGGEAGFRRFRDAPQTFGLVVTDLQMPGCSGLELASAVRKIRPDLPILLLSGFYDEAQEERARAAGIDAFLTKPVYQRDLAAAVERLLGAGETVN